MVVGAPQQRGPTLFPVVTHQVCPTAAIGRDIAGYQSRMRPGTFGRVENSIRWNSEHSGGSFAIVREKSGKRDRRINDP
ncbi:hypothetical protein GCM10027444_24010 [Actinopolyspora lacussalsi]